MPTAKLGDIEMYYEEKGSGEAVLLVPASWWPSDTWNVGVVPFLSKQFRTIIFDCRGTGRTSKPKDGYTVARFAEDCIALLTHLGVSRCHAVGFALGGQIVQAMAIERPDLVATLTIAASGAGSRTLAGGQRSLSPDTKREIQEKGFERYIRNYIENDSMAFNPIFYREHNEVVAALADAVWSGQSTWCDRTWRRDRPCPCRESRAGSRPGLFPMRLLKNSVGVLRRRSGRTEEF